jgi:hypothetical protein
LRALKKWVEAEGNDVVSLGAGSYVIIAGAEKIDAVAVLRSATDTCAAALGESFMIEKQKAFLRAVWKLENVVLGFNGELE